jgi:GcrA cell cycle regulator
MDWWTPEREAELRIRFANGETGTQICIGMGAKSRSAVIGKLHRMQLHRLPRAFAPRNEARAPRVIRRSVLNGSRFHVEQTAAVMFEEPPAMFENPLRLVELKDDQCRFPGNGEPGPEMLYCAAPVVAGLPYCAHHCRIAYVKPGSRPKEKRQ